MKIAFIEPSIMFVEPMGIGYLSQMLIKEGHKVKYFESPRGKFIERLKEFKPDVLAYNITTGKHKICQNLNSLLRKHINAISLFGGPHCTFFPEFIESDDFIDGICRGEGEYAIVELINKMESNEDYTKVANWWLRVGEEIHKNPLRKRIENLDELPFPNRDIIYEENEGIRNNPIKRFITSRGCPFSCSYCFNKKYNEIYKSKKIFFQRSAENVIEEILEVKRKYTTTFVRFFDDNFSLRDDLEEFTELYKDKINLPFLCILRANLITEKKVKLLRRAGCVAVCFAIESGNDFIRNQILNRNMSSETIRNAIGMLRKEGIRIWTQNIIANPRETFDMMMETYNINVRNKVNFAECFILNPYPGTDIHNYCVKNNYFDGDVNKLQQSYWLGSPLRFNSKREKRMMINFHKLFSFTVNHPRTLPLIKNLIKLPPNKLFVLFNQIYWTWEVSRIVRADFNIRNFISTVRLNLDWIFSYFMSDD